uniref:sialate O-acetylesterase n=2 Tax=Flavobacterium sp. TaxID=239 RepID=UPI00404B515D
MNAKFKFFFLVKTFLFIGFLMISCADKKSKVEETGTTYKLYFAGGQSNMEGFGFADDLPDDYKGIIKNVMIFNGSQAPDDAVGGGYGQWMPLSAGFGTGYKVVNDSVFLSDRFGPELSFGKHLAELTQEKIAIIKYARGGSSIALGGSGFGTWAKNYEENTTVNQWDHFENTLKNAFKTKDIDGDGIADKLIPAGIIWMQGEADAYDEPSSKVYFENLTQLMQDITAAFGVEKLPIVICRIEDSGKTPAERVMPHIESVWEAQIKYAQMNDNVDMIQLSQPIEFLEDIWHYKSTHYIEMGKSFAEKIK